MSDIKIQPSATGSATVTLTAPVSNTARTITLPDSTSTLLASEGAVTINESGADLDFRVESDNDANALFVQGSDGNVGIGISTPTNPLTVEGDGARIAFSNTATYPCLGGISAFRSGTSHGNMYIETAGGSNFNTPVERMAIEGTTGEVKISTGDLIFGTAGKGIVLGNTSNVDANTLDDYEEGTFTPTLADASGNTIAGTQTGFYTKVGRNVTFEINLSVGSHSGTTGANEAQVNGLPFASANTIYSPHTTSAGSMANDVGRGVIFQIFPQQSYGRFYKDNWGTGSHVSVKIQDFGTSGFVRISGTYIAT